MEWILLTRAEATNFKKTKLLPWSKRQEVAFAVESDQNRSWLVEANFGQRNGKKFPVCLLKEDELLDRKSWELLLSFSPGNRVDIAAYSAHHPEISPDIFMSILGIKSHYKTRADWEELGKIDDLSRELGRKFNFPIHVLRLWNRIGKEERKQWYQIWEQSRMKSKFIREIIEDFYELSNPERFEVLAAIDKLCKKHQKNSLATLTGETVLQIVRKTRNPEFEGLKLKLHQLKRNLNLSKAINIIIPTDLESADLRITIDIGKKEDIEKSLNQLMEVESKEILTGIAELLR